MFVKSIEPKHLTENVSVIFLEFVKSQKICWEIADLADFTDKGRACCERAMIGEVDSAHGIDPRLQRGVHLETEVEIRVAGLEIRAVARPVSNHIGEGAGVAGESDRSAPGG